MKLTPYHRTEILKALIYRRLIHRTEPKPPTYLFRYINVKKRGDKNYKMRQTYPARPACRVSEFSQLPNPGISAPTRPLHPQSIAARPVRGVLRLLNKSRKGFLEDNRDFNGKGVFFCVSGYLGQFCCADVASD